MYKSDYTISVVAKNCAGASNSAKKKIKTGNSANKVYTTVNPDCIKGENSNTILNFQVY